MPRRFANADAERQPEVTAGGVAAESPSPSAQGGEALNAPLAGNIFKVLVSEGDHVSRGDVVLIMEAMKMETEVRAASDGTITSVHVNEGDSVTSGQPLLTLG